MKFELVGKMLKHRSGRKMLSSFGLAAGVGFPKVGKTPLPVFESFAVKLRSVHRTDVQTLSSRSRLANDRYGLILLEKYPLIGWLIADSNPSSEWED